VSPRLTRPKGLPEALSQTDVYSGGQVARLAVVGVGKVSSCGAHLVELLPLARDGVRKVDDIEASGPPNRVIWTARMPRPQVLEADETSCRPGSSLRLGSLVLAYPGDESREDLLRG
jgi:hypothetical protein